MSKIKSRLHFCLKFNEICFCFWEGTKNCLYNFKPMFSLHSIKDKFCSTLTKFKNYCFKYYEKRFKMQLFIIFSKIMHISRKKTLPKKIA